MAQATINRLRDLIRSLNSAVPIHAVEELDDDNLAVVDLESIILTGAVVKIALDGTLFVITVSRV